MKKVKAYKLGDGGTVFYNVPSRDEALAYSKETQGEQYDKIEERVVRGGLPMLWEKVS